ncbi:MAG: NitT/TauT family transport system substrate-binding protein [Candidatus Binatota bacterium]|nr:NitT/TauT family transport system substrate-binding protein [Candidatus Binatota bacterium]
MNSASSKFIFTLALMLGAMAYGDCTKAQERLRVAWAGGASNAAIWIVQEKGLLKKQEVNAEFISVSASPMALQAMIAGEVDVIVTSVTTLVNSRLTGADVVMIASIVPTFPAHIITQKSVTDIKQLKGKIGGVGRAGTTTEIGMRLGLSRLGIDPNTDVKLVPVGATADALAALSKGVVQFSILVEPFVREAEKLGFKSLVDVSTLNIPFHWNGVLTREPTIRSKGSLMTKIVRALVEAIHIFKTDKDSTLKIISKFTRITNPDSLERTHQAFARLLPETPSPSPEGVKTYLDYVTASRTEAAKANPKEFVDLRFVQEVQASGFIRQLYGR